jgi:ADP-ribose pyrophosphatase YjhB (NUDIX family)
VSRGQVATTYRWRATAWGELRFAAQGYLADAPPTGRPVTSVRTILLDGRKVLVCKTPDGPHVWPGGRQEFGESPTATVVREVLEETGWEVEVGPFLGHVHLRHLQPEPQDYPFPYPAFSQLVYVSAPIRHLTGERWSDVEGWESDATFVDAEAVPDVDAVQAMFLGAALRSTAGGSEAGRG